MTGNSINALKRAKIIFDLNGYVVIRNVLGSTEIMKAKSVAENRLPDFKERKGDSFRNSHGAKLDTISGDGVTGRFDLGGILDWNDGDIFRSFLCHPKLEPYLTMILGEGYRMDHEPFLIRQIFGSEGFNLHGGPCRELQYSVVNGDVTTSLLGAVFFINKQDKEDGGFCVVKGSHKLNFPMPGTFKNGEDKEFFEEHVFPVSANPGDVVLFSEATVHGSFAWTNQERDRLMALYRFSPATNANARGYLSSPNREHFTDREKAVLQPPYDPRFDRTILAGEGVSVHRRAEHKKAFDKEVFGKEFY